jgi:hypothetical protein
MNKKIFAFGALAACFFATVAVAETWKAPSEIAPQQAQTQPAAPATPSATAPAKPAAATVDDRKAKAKECSAQADAKGLHGKARKHFRDECKHGKI